jgi:hypothetical protein
MKTPAQNFVQLSSAFAVLALNLFIIQPTKAGIFTNTGSMTTARYWHTATLLPNGMVLVAGGYDGSNDLSSAELYNPATGTWMATGAMTTVHVYHTATLLPNGKVLVAGGAVDYYLSTAELYDPTNRTWTTTGAMIAGRWGHTATLLPNGKVLVAGGFGVGIGNGSLSSAELYDPASGTWTATGAMTTTRTEHTATLLPNRKVLVAGGYDNAGNSISTTELYDPTTGTWTATGSLTTARQWHTATLLSNGMVLVAGGYDGNYISSAKRDLSSAELYDPATGTWTATGSLTNARIEHTATLLPDGKVLVAGGFNGSAISSAELYDPATGTWPTTGAMTTTRTEHTATLLSNGMVLVAGGYNSSDGSGISSAELYGSIWTITATQSPISAGSTTGSGNYTNGSSVIVTATAALGYYFVEWTENGNFVSDSSDYNFVIYDDRVLVANFSADAIRPTVSISNPASAKTYTNAQTVTITATASDNVGVTSVEFYDGGTLKGADTTAPYTYDWPFTAADNGAHVWTARAYDAAQNVSTSRPVTLTVSIDITPPTVAISSPANGANLSTSPTTVSGTASDPGSPASGVAAVEVRLNGGSWSNATGTARWTRSVTLAPCDNTIEARSRDKAGNYSTIASNFVTYTPPNTVPNTPTNLYPPNGAAAVPVTPTLEASAFSDPDPVCLGDIHAASQWQVLNSPGAAIVADSGTDTVNKVSWTVPTNKLYYGSNYQWHVRYRDSRNGWSSYSAQTRFTNGGPWLIGLQQGTKMVFKWPTNALAFGLQWSTNLSTRIWSNAVPAPVIVSGQYTVTNNMTNKARFYRLKK